MTIHRIGQQVCSGKKMASVHQTEGQYITFTLTPSNVSRPTSAWLFHSHLQGQH